MSEREFGQLLTEGIRHICAYESKQMQVVEDELGYAVRRNGSSAIRYWRKGHWPADSSIVEALARQIVRRGRLGRTWLERFLRSAHYPDPDTLCDELFPNYHARRLPIPSTPLIGRAGAVTTICSMLKDSQIRLLSLTGAPGVGKTRLALQAASELQRDFLDGVVFVRLAPILNPELFIITAANALGLIENDDQVLQAHLMAYLRDRNMLLVLDNFEQVIVAAPRVAELLSAAPLLKVLVTSREPLHIYDEHEYPVPPLQVPEPGDYAEVEGLAQIPSVQLFTGRAQAVNPHFRLTIDNARSVASVCAHLDGLPLAIELAAARSKWIAPEQMLKYLDNRLTLLVEGPRDRPMRHQSLQAAFDWSYALLSGAEQKVFRWLSVFQGGCTIEAVEMVCTPSDRAANHLVEVSLLQLLASLQDKNLLQSAPSSGAPDKFRYSMLETILEYANYKLLEAGEAEEAQRRHVAWCLQLAAQASQNLRGPDQLLWLNQLDEEINNFRKSLLWCVEHPVQIEPGLRIAADLHWFWRLRSRLSEGRDWLDRLLAIDLQADAPRSTRQAQAQAMRAASSLHGLLGNPARALELALSSLNLAEEIGDQSGVISSKVQLSKGIFLSGNVHQGVSLAEEAFVLCQSNGDRFNEAELLDRPLGTAALLQGDYARSVALHEQALALRRALHDTDGEAWSLFLLAGSVYALGDMRRAQTLYEESCTLWRQVGNWRWYADALDELGRVVCKRGDYAQAQVLFEESLTTAQKIYDPYRMARAMCDLARAASTVEDYTQAQALLKQTAVHVGELVNTPLLAMFLISAAQLASLTGRAEHAARLAGAAQTALRHTNFVPVTSDRAEFESIWSAICTAVSKEIFDQACAEGEAMSQRAALAYATHEDSS